MTMEVLNPATGETMAEVPESSAEDVDAAVSAARKALPGWAATPPGERAAALLKLADRIESSAVELADMEAKNAGKPRQAFLDDVRRHGVGRRRQRARRGLGALGFAR